VSDEVTKGIHFAFWAATEWYFVKIEWELWWYWSGKIRDMCASDTSLDMHFIAGVWNLTMSRNRIRCVSVAL